MNPVRNRGREYDGDMNTVVDVNTNNQMGRSAIACAPYF